MSPVACKASKRLSTELARSTAQICAGPVNALKLPCPELLHLEEIAKELSRTLGNDNRVRLGHSLQPRRQVWRLADYAALVRLPFSNQVADYDEPGCNVTIS